MMLESLPCSIIIERDAKRAYHLFREANQFVPGYQEVNDMIAEAKFNATLKVIVEQIPVPTRYKLSANFLPG